MEWADLYDEYKDKDSEELLIVKTLTDEFIQISDMRLINQNDEKDEPEAIL